MFSYGLQLSEDRGRVVWGELSRERVVRIPSLSRTTDMTGQSCYRKNPFYSSWVWSLKKVNHTKGSYRVINQARLFSARIIPMFASCMQLDNTRFRRVKAELSLSHLHGRQQANIRRRNKMLIISAFCSPISHQKALFNSTILRLPDVGVFWNQSALGSYR